MKKGKRLKTKMCTKAIKINIKQLEQWSPDTQLNVLNCVMLSLYKEVLEYRKLKKK